MHAMRSIALPLLGCLAVGCARGTETAATDAAEVGKVPVATSPAPPSEAAPATTAAPGRPAEALPEEGAADDPEGRAALLAAVRKHAVELNEKRRALFERENTLRAEHAGIVALTAEIAELRKQVQERELAIRQSIEEDAEWQRLHGAMTTAQTEHNANRRQMMATLREAAGARSIAARPPRPELGGGMPERPADKPDDKAAE